MKKILMIVIIITFISITLGVVIGNELLTPAEKYNTYKNKLAITEERFLKDVKIRNIGNVMTAASMAKGFNMELDEVYALLDENNGDINKVGEILRNRPQRKEPLYLPSKPTEEEAKKITESLKNGKNLSDPRGNAIDNNRILDLSYNLAIKTFNEAKFLYAFDEETLIELMKERPCGEVILAGNLAYNFKMTVDYVLSILDEYKADYHNAYNQLYDEWMAYEREFNN